MRIDCARSMYFFSSLITCKFPQLKVVGWKILKKSYIILQHNDKYNFSCHVRAHIPLQPEMTCDPASVSVTPPVAPSFSHKPGVWIICTLDIKTSSDCNVKKEKSSKE